MKKTFSLKHEKITTPRLVDAIKHEVKKYIRRERKKSLPEGADFLDFDCKYGHTEETAEVVHLSAMNKHIDEAERLELSNFYIEIMAKSGFRTAMPLAQEGTDEE
jgi:hypothetical protein